MDSGIYSITNKINRKRYIGSTKNFDRRKREHFDLLTKDEHWNIKLQRSYNKNGSGVFIFEIIELCDYSKDLIIEKEQYWIDHYDSKNKGYNIADASFGDTLSVHPEKQRIINQIRSTIKERVSNMTEDEKSKTWGRFGVKNGRFGKCLSIQAINNIKKANKGRTDLRGYKHSEETKRRMSVAAKNRKMSGKQNPFYGKTHNEETKKKLSNCNKGKKPVNSKKVSILGVEYMSQTEASEKTGIPLTTISYRVRSCRYPDYLKK